MAHITAIPMGNQTSRNKQFPFTEHRSTPTTTATNNTNAATATRIAPTFASTDVVSNHQQQQQQSLMAQHQHRPPPHKKPSARKAQQHTTKSQQQQQQQQQQRSKSESKQQRLTPAFRQKVASANKTAICTTTSGRVGRKTLRQLMHPSSSTMTASASVHEAYIVPIFQRRYCWTTIQWDTLWHDILKRHSAKHSLGRLTCTNVGNDDDERTTSSNHHHHERTQTNNRIVRSVIIDGQQRFTTVTLILAAIRDVLVDNSSSEGGERKSKSETLLRSIHEMLFLDPSAMEEWVAAASNNSLSEGLAPSFCRLIPTFCDRSAYLAAILPPSTILVQTFLSETYNPRWHRPLLAKQHFVNTIRSLLVSSSSSSQQQPPHRVLAKLTRSLLDGIDMLYFPIDVQKGYTDGTEDTQVIYERLAIRDATFCKPTRATEYHSMDGTDMIRNLFLGSFATSTETTKFYETLWLPLERTFQTTTGDDDTMDSSQHGDQEEESLKAFFRAFLEHQRTPPEGSSSLVSSSVDDDSTSGSGQGIIGGRIYRDFETWMAKDFERWQTTTTTVTSTTDRSPSSLSSPPEQQQHTTDVGKQLLEFAATRRMHR